jgi:hypothetical protein
MAENGGKRRTKNARIMPTMANIIPRIAGTRTAKSHLGTSNKTFDAKCQNNTALTKTLTHAATPIRSLCTTRAAA